jgi:hypothetical protein
MGLCLFAFVMNAQTLTKAQKRELRRLAATAHERELAVAVTALENEFNRWRRGEMDVFALNEQIHKYHDGVSRELYKRYVLGEPQWAVAFAVRRGVLQEKELTREMLSYIGGLVEFFVESGTGK